MGWSEAYEPRRGSGTGMPDVQVLLDDILLPVELKLGEVKGDRIFASDFQPAQVSWHTKFHLAGGRAIFLVGLWQGSRHPDGDWCPIKLPEVSVKMLLGRDEGWPLVECEQWTRWLP